MSAHDQMRKMLDELMGSGRDGSQREVDYEYSDFRVCRAYLLGCCPNDVLAATRINMGECDKIHDAALRADFDKAQKEKDHFYDLDALDQLERFFEDCDRKQEQSKRRLAETQEELSVENSEKANKVLEINEQIGKTLAEAERLGNEGKVEESMKLMDQLEQLKKEKYAADDEYRNSMPASSYQQQKLRVCEVCSAYLGIHDNDRRLADHFGGKLHMGFVFLRDRLEELRSIAEERREKREADRRLSSSNRYGSSSDRRGNDYGGRRDRDARKRSRSRDREREKDRDYKRRSRSRDRERRRRSRSRSRNGRDDRKRRSRSRDGSRDKDRRTSKSNRDRDRDKGRDKERSVSPDNRKSSHSKSRDRRSSRSTPEEEAKAAD